MKAHFSEIVDSNYLSEPEANRIGVPYPRTYATIKLPWLATPTNPDPISPHPVPVMTNKQHRGKLDWEPLKPGTRVVVLEVDRSRHNPLGLAVIAYGPQNTDDLYGDLRETAEYVMRPGDSGIDKWVDSQEDPVYGPNEDVGRTHLDSRGLGWQTRLPFPLDPTRVKHDTIYPDATVEAMHRTDDTEHYWRFTLPGTSVTYTFEFDAIAQTWKLTDDKLNEFSLDSAAMTFLMKAVTSITLTSALVQIGSETEAEEPSVVLLASAPDTLGFYGADGTTKPTVTGSKEGNAALTSLCAALASLGLITDATS